MKEIHATSTVQLLQSHNFPRFYPLYVVQSHNVPHFTLCTWSSQTPSVRGPVTRLPSLLPSVRGPVTQPPSLYPVYVVQSHNFPRFTLCTWSSHTTSLASTLCTWSSHTPSLALPSVRGPVTHLPSLYPLYVVQSHNLPRFTLCMWSSHTTSLASTLFTWSSHTLSLALPSVRGPVTHLPSLYPLYVVQSHNFPCFTLPTWSSHTTLCTWSSDTTSVALPSLCGPVTQPPSLLPSVRGPVKQLPSLYPLYVVGSRTGTGTSDFCFLCAVHLFICRVKLHALVYDILP